MLAPCGYPKQGVEISSTAVTDILERSNGLDNRKMKYVSVEPGHLTQERIIEPSILADVIGTPSRDQTYNQPSVFLKNLKIGYTAIDNGQASPEFREDLVKHPAYMKRKTDFFELVPGLQNTNKN